MKVCLECRFLVASTSEYDWSCPGCGYSSPFVGVYTECQRTKGLLAPGQGHRPLLFPKGLRGWPSSWWYTEATPGEFETGVAACEHLGAEAADFLNGHGAAA